MAARPPSVAGRATPLPAAPAALHPLEAPLALADRDFFSEAPAPLVRPPREQASGLERLRLLGRQGAWRSIIERSRQLLSINNPQIPRSEVLGYAAYLILALCKMRMYSFASDQLKAIGAPRSALRSSLWAARRLPHRPLDAPGNKVGGVSVVPFALFWLQAELLQRLGQPRHCADALCELLHRCDAAAKECEQRQREAEANPAGAGAGGASAGAHARGEGDGARADSAALASSSAAAAAAEEAVNWRRRKEMVLFSLVSHHCHLRNPLVALQWLNAIAIEMPSPAVFCAAAHLLLQMGDIDGAAKAAAMAETAANSRDGGPRADELAAVDRTQSLLLLAQKNFLGAREKLEAALAARPWDAIAANNAAVAALYAGDLGGAVRTLERALRAEPLAVATETVVQNLCGLYELASPDPEDSKRRLATWLGRVVPDDFDGSSASRA